MNQMRWAIALVAPEAPIRQRLCHVLHELGPEIEVLSSTALTAALGAGRRFAMLVLALQGGAPEVRREVDQIQAFAEGQMPLMLLMRPAQVEAAMSVMTCKCNDYLLMPATDQELYDRLSRLYFGWSWTELHHRQNANRRMSSDDTWLLQGRWPTAVRPDEH